MKNFNTLHEAAMYVSAEAERLNGSYSDDLAQYCSGIAQKQPDGTYSVSDIEVAVTVSEWQEFV